VRSDIIYVEGKFLVLDFIDDILNPIPLITVYYEPLDSIDPVAATIGLGIM